MNDLTHFNAKICYTACGHLIHEGKILLVKHKKLQSWLSPGGHIELNELPHQAAEREFLEETGLKVQVVSATPLLLDVEEVQILPQPVLTNLHWVSKANYDMRTKADADTEAKTDSNPWKKGCEQHLGFVFLVKPLGSLEYRQDLEETDGIGWFDQEELDSLEMLDNIRKEILLAFELSTITKKY